MMDGVDGLPVRIAAVRRRLGLSQDAFAERLGVGRNMVIRWERGHSRPRAARVAMMAQLGGVTPEWLLTGGEGRGRHQDREWQEAVDTLRTLWPDRRRRAALLLVLRALGR